MGISEGIKKFREAIRPEPIAPKKKVLATTSLSPPGGKVTGDLIPEIPPIYSHWMFSALYGQPRQIDLVKVREFAKSPWVQMCINTIKKEIMQIPWKIVLIDEDNPEDDIKDYDADVKKVTDFLNKCNVNNETLPELMSAIITDLGEVDAGVWAKVYSKQSFQEVLEEVTDVVGNPTGKTSKVMRLKPVGQRELLQFWYADGGSFIMDVDIHRRIRGYWQYTFKYPSNRPLYFERDEVCYFQLNRRSYNIYGYSPTQACQQEIELMIQSTRFNKDFFLNNAIPPAILTLPDNSDENLEELKTQWQQNLKGEHNRIAILTGNADLKTLSTSNKDMQWLDGQKWYYHLILGMFGMSPAEVGFHENINRSCYSNDTEVLTENGWKKHSDWKTGEKIAVVDKYVNEISYEHPKDYKVYNVEEQLIHITNKRNDILVTDNHTILYKERRGNDWEVSEASKLKYDRMKLPTAPNEFLGDDIKTMIIPKIDDSNYKNRKEKKVNMDDWLEFLGWYLSEGGLSSTSSGYLITFAQKDKDNCKKIESLFKRLKLTYGSYTDKSDGCQRWNVYGRNIWTWLKENCGDYSHNKKVPKFVFNLCEEQQKIIFDSMMLGDGHIRDKYGFSLRLTSKQLIDDFGRIALVLGYSTSYSNGRKKRKPYHHDMYNLNINLKNFSQIQSKDISKVDYKGIVWCFQTSTGFFVTRRNGKVAIQGNTQEGQERVTVKNAIKPYLEKFEQKINREIIPDLLKTEEPKLKIKFFPKDHAAEQMEFDQDMKKIDQGVMTVNEYRKKQGLEEVEWGDTPKNQGSVNDNASNFPGGAQGETNGNPGDNSLPPKTPNASGITNVPERPKEKPKPKKNLKKGVEAEQEELVDESKSYDAFIVKVMNEWEVQALKAVDKIDISKSLSSPVNKTFGEFLQTLFNGINSSPFFERVRKFVSSSAKEGLKQAESDVGMDIGVSLKFDTRVEALASQELNGYTIHGKRWFGMKGVADDTRDKILEEVAEAVRNKEGRKEVKDRVKDIFKSATDSQAARIARTETSRFVNEGKLQGYVDSGIDGLKTWQNHNPESEVCKRLTDTYSGVGIPFNEPFIDRETGKQYMYPPAHPNCKSIIQFLQKISD